MKCPKCGDMNAHKAVTKYGDRLRCNACDGWFHWVTQPQDKVHQKLQQAQQQIPTTPVKNDRDASITAIAFIKSILENKETAQVFFDLGAKTKEDVREEIWALFVWFRERCRKYE
jgi:hypothetical protein